LLQSEHEKDIVDRIIEEQRPKIEASENFNEDGSINWEAHGRNAWLLLHDAYEQVQEELERKNEAVSKFPRTDTGITVDGLWRKVGDLVPNPDPITPKTYERMALDPKVSACLETITNATVRGWEITGGKQEHRDFIENMLRKMDMNNIFKQVINRTLQFGHTSTEKVYDVVDGKWEIIKYKVLVSKDVEYKITATGEIRQIWQFVSAWNNFPSSSASQNNTMGLNRLNGYRKFTPIKINHMTFKPMYSNPYGQSILKGVNKIWIVKDHMLRYWSRHLEVLGSAMIIAKAGGMKTEKFRREIDKAKATSTIVMQDGQEIDIKWPPSAGSPFKEMIVWMDSKVSEVMIVPDLLLGQSASAGVGGSKDLSETHFALFKLTRIDPLQEDLRNWLDGDIRLLIDTNFPGPHEEYPEIVFKAWSTLELEQLANFYRKLAMMQAIGTDDIEWIRERLELPPMGPNGIGDPLVKIQNQPGQGDGSDGGGDTTDSTDSTKREGVGGVS
jgi:hypothetical protein